MAKMKSLFGVPTLLRIGSIHAEIKFSWKRLCFRVFPFAFKVEGFISILKNRIKT